MGLQTVKVEPHLPSLQLAAMAHFDSCGPGLVLSLLKILSPSLLTTTTPTPPALSLMRVFSLLFSLKQRERENTSYKC